MGGEETSKECERTIEKNRKPQESGSVLLRVNIFSHPQVSFCFYLDDASKTLGFCAEIPAFMVMGCLGGIMGAVFNGCNKKLSMQRKIYVATKRAKLIEVLVMSFLVSTVGILVPLFFLTNCETIPTNPSLDPRAFVRFGCGTSQYSPSASVFFSPLDVALKSLFHSMNFSVHYLIVTILYLCIFFVLSCLNYGIHVPSGLFVPTLLLGAAFGRLCGEALKLAMPSGSTVDPGTYALIGAAAMLGPASESTFL